MTRRVRVGPKVQPPNEVGVPGEAGAGPVTAYIVGDFEWYSGRCTTPHIKVSGKAGVIVSASLLDQACAPSLPEFWRVGVDAQKGLVELRPVGHGETGLRLRVSERMGKFQSSVLVAWLRSKGVPDDAIPARWQLQTQSIVGRFKPPTQKPA